MKRIIRLVVVVGVMLVSLSGCYYGHPSHYNGFYDNGWRDRGWYDGYYGHDRSWIHDRDDRHDHYRGERYDHDRDDNHHYDGDHDHGERR